MKRLLTLIAVVIVTAIELFAGTDIKRPESFNYQRAIEAYNNKNYDEALEYFNKELQENQNNGYAYCWIADIHARKEELGNALQAASKSIKLLPSKDKEFICITYGIRSKIYLAMEDTLKALDDMDAALKIDPDNKDILESRGNIYYYMDQYDKSDADYLKLIALDEAGSMGHMGYGRNLLDEEQLPYITGCCRQESLQ